MGEFQMIAPVKALALPARVTSAGHADERLPAYDWDGLKRKGSEFTLFQWTLSGRGRLEFEGAEFDVNPGEAILLQIPHWHRYYLPRDSDHWRFIYVCLHGAEVMRLTGEFIRNRGPIWRLGADSGAVRTAVKIYESGMKQELQSPFAASALGYELLMQLGMESDPSTDAANRFREVLAFIESHHGEEIQVTELARVAGMSRFHFTRQFTQAMGTSPGEYLLQARVRHAARLLTDPRLNIKEVADRSGFGSANYLSKVFRRVLGISPREFRSSGMYSNRIRRQQ